MLVRFLQCVCWVCIRPQQDLQVLVVRNLVRHVRTNCTWCGCVVCGVGCVECGVGGVVFGVFCVCCGCEIPPTAVGGYFKSDLFTELCDE